MILKVLGVEVGIKNRSKNEVILGRHLGIDFSLIFVENPRHALDRAGPGWIRRRFCAPSIERADHSLQKMSPFYTPSTEPESRWRGYSGHSRMIRIVYPVYILYI